jgi:hypothetical protein
MIYTVIQGNKEIDIEVNTTAHALEKIISFLAWDAYHQGYIFDLNKPFTIQVSQKQVEEVKQRIMSYV